jgi:hypothetical protein
MSVAAIAPNALLPHGLAVWDGHIAMSPATGRMIQAGHQ